MILPSPSSTLFPYTTLFRSPQSQEAFPGPPAPAPRTRVRVSCVVDPVDQQPPGNCDLGWHSEDDLRHPVSRRWQRAADRKSTRLNSSHSSISYAVFCLKKKI